MTCKIIVFKILILLLWLAPNCYSQIRTEVIGGDTVTIFRFESEDKVDIELKTNLKQKEDPSIFEYNYDLKSLDNSIQEIYRFKIFGLENVASTETPIGWFKLNSTANNSAGWASKDSLNRISPDERKDGFIIRSKNLPGIVNFKVWGWVPVPVFDEVPDSTENSSSFDGKLGTTIGPVHLPDKKTANELLNTLHSYLSFSCDTTWIENQGICNSLQAKLENVQEQVAQNNNKAAGNNLRAFLNQLNALKEKQISSEVYALLYFNGVFLKERLED
ncbi:MAG: hypothetical protein U5K71_03135 [Gracilimonas sp.]|nr:hypothetical protein [Gracilimonas sp.]